jgi:hypothetical protein
MITFAVFFDILGTNHYFNSLPDDYDFSKDSDYRGYKYARNRFYSAITAATQIYPSGLLFHASFSDCAYLIYEQAEAISKASSFIMRRVLGDVPVRGGIGLGNFGLGGAFQMSNGRSISSEASFFGSAIARAHTAEGCGLKGFRIFVHASAVDELKKTHQGIKIYPEIDYSQFDEDMPPPPDVGGTVVDLLNPINPEVKHELCFIGHDGLDLYFRKISMLEKLFPPTKSASIHYQESRATLNRFKELRESI